MAINRFTAFLFLVLSASPFTAPFSTVSGSPLHLSERTVIAVPDDTGATRSSDEHSPAYSVPSLPEGARVFVGDAPGATPGWADVTYAARLAALDLLARDHVRAGPVPIPVPSGSSISILRI